MFLPPWRHKDNLLTAGTSVHIQLQWFLVTAFGMHTGYGNPHSIGRRSVSGGSVKITNQYFTKHAVNDIVISPLVQFLWHSFYRIRLLRLN